MLVNQNETCKKFKLEYNIHGIFPDPIEKKIIDGIEIKSTNPKSGKSVIVVQVNSNSEKQAILDASDKLNMLLETYSLFTYLDFQILNSEFPLKIANMSTKKSELVKVEKNTLKIAFDINNFTENLPKFWQILSEKNKSYIRIALQFLMKARKEQSYDSTLINCFVALEALFSKEEEKTEMKYRISNRIATLLGKNKKSRLKIRKTIRNLYDDRSKIIHGSTKIKQVNLDMILPWTNEAIIRFVDLSQIYGKQKDIIDKIDDASIDHQSLKELRKQSYLLLNDIENARKWGNPKISGPKDSYLIPSYKTRKKE